jgi:FkbH-like protein
MNGAASALTRAEWQPLLFKAPNRADLTACEPVWPLHRVRVRVHRNHGFEAVSSATPAFAAWNEILFDWRIGAYDDSLSFQLEQDADVELVWLDTARIVGLAQSGLAEWLLARLRSMRAQTTRPIVVLAWPLDEAEHNRLDRSGIPGVHVVDLQAVADSLGSRWIDPRVASISGTRLSAQACLRIARELACRWLPAAILPPRKAIAVDLDGTLYRGVLGEDGADGVQLTEGHRRLQSRLADLRDQGMLLALVSRNELDDVEALFERRRDFPLRLTDFSAIEVSWDDKRRALCRAAASMRIAPDSMVFVDDNPAELSAVAQSLPVLTVHAEDDGDATAAALDHVSGIFRWRNSIEDKLRAADLRAAEERTAIELSVASDNDYLQSLDVRLRFFVGPRAHTGRCAELSTKTNQFNLALARMNEAEIARRIDEHPSNVIAVHLADRLSDSGIVALVVGRRVDDLLHVEEVCVSCRALGRRLEDALVVKGLVLMAGSARPARLAFVVRRGPRNAPARQWLMKLTGEVLRDDAERCEVPFARVAERGLSSAIAMEVVS